MTHQHWLELRGEDGSADGLWSSTYEVVAVSGSKFSRAVAVFAACLLTPLSLGTLLSQLQDDPLGPRCSSAAALAPLQPKSRRPSVRGAHSCSRPSSRWCPGRRRGGGVGTQLNQGGLGVSRWLLWLSRGADGRPWWSVSAPLSPRWVSRWETFYFCLYDVQFGDKCKIFLNYLTQKDLDLVFIFTWAFCCRMSALLRPPPVEVTVHFQAPSTRPGSYMNEMWPLCLNTRLSASRTLRCWNIAQYDPYLILFFPQGTLLFLGLATRCQSLTDVAPTCSVCLFQRGYVRLKKAPRSVILPVLRVFLLSARWTWESLPWQSAATNWTCVTTPAAPTSTAAIPSSAGASTASVPTSRKVSALFRKWKVSEIRTFSLFHHKKGNISFPLLNGWIDREWLLKEGFWNDSWFVWIKKNI